jgi:hypothetical protein
MAEDAIALGVRHGAINVSLAEFLTLDSPPDGIRWTSRGRAFVFSRRGVEHADARIKPLSDAGVVVYLILLAYPTREAARDAVLIHPAARKDYRFSVAAFNTVTGEGRAWFQAFCEFLADRYSAPESPHGRVWGYIVGNEANSHGLWYNRGPATLDEVAADYEPAVRLVHQAVRRASMHARVYLSLDHHWTASMPGVSEMESTPGRAFLDRFASLARERGDFDWHVATHPYPDDLGNPRTWLDKAAPPHEDAPHITFKNLEVMDRHMRRPGLLFNGKPRRVILSEQGFHCLPAPHGPELQAAAFCYAWEKVHRCPGIDAFIWHRHVDHKHEGGLNLGLWERKPDSICDPLRPRPVYDLFKKAGTAGWDDAAKFALPIVGLKSWDELKGS